MVRAFHWQYGDILLPIYFFVFTYYFVLSVSLKNKYTILLYYIKTCFFMSVVSMSISSTVSNSTALIWKHCRRYICGFLCIMWCGACDNLKSCETGSVIGRYHQYESQQTLSFFVSQRTDLPFFPQSFLA